MTASDRIPAGDVGPRLGVLLAIFDFPALVAGYRALIGSQPDMAVVDVLDDRDALRERAARTAADLAITECHPYPSSGCASFQAIETVRAGNPAIKVLAIESRPGSEQFSLAIKAGASGFLNREAEPVDVLDAIHCVARGDMYVSPVIVTRMVNAFVLRAPDTDGDAYDTLSERAREVLRLAAYGHSNREIARTLHISEQTVHNHRATIMERLGFHDRVELLRFALRRGVIEAAEL